MRYPTTKPTTKLTAKPAQRSYMLRYEHGIQFALTDTAEPAMRTRELCAEASRRARNNGHILYPRWYLTVDHADESVIARNDCQVCHLDATIDSSTIFDAPIIEGRAVNEGCPGHYHDGTTPVDHQAVDR